MNGRKQAASRPWMPLLAAVVGSVCGTLITAALDKSPSVALVGAVLGAAIPTIVGYAGPAHGLRASAGIAITVVALFVTYGGFTVLDFAKDRPKTFPIPSSLPQPEENAGAAVTTTAGELGIEVTPDTLHCSIDGCEEPVVIKSTGDQLLRIGDIEFDGEAATTFNLSGKCENRSLSKDEECQLTVSFTPSGSAGTRNARLVIHQNLPELPTYVDLEGKVESGDPTPTPTGDLLASGAVECRHQRAGAIVNGEAKDALQILFSVRLEGASPDQLQGLVLVTAHSNLGPSASARGGVGNGSLVAQLALRPEDYGRTHTVTVSIDPNNEVPESNEDNNQFTVTVGLPAQPGSPQLLPC